MKELKRLFRRTIALTLCVGMLLQSTCVNAAGTDGGAADAGGIVADGSDSYAADAVSQTDRSLDEEISDNHTEDQGDIADGTRETTADFSAVYTDGVIQIWNADQLAAIGTGAAVTSTDNAEGQLGQGTPVTDADGAQITYSPDAQYQLVNDIPMTAGSIWNLPAGFTGSFTSGDGSAVTKDAPLYDSATDTIYVYNSYQLDVIRSENAANEPVMSNDMIAEEFGMGQLVYPDGTPAEGDGVYRGEAGAESGGGDPGGWGSSVWQKVRRTGDLDR